MWVKRLLPLKKKKICIRTQLLDPNVPLCIEHSRKYTRMSAVRTPGTCRRVLPTPRTCSSIWGTPSHLYKDASHVLKNLSKLIKKDFNVYKDPPALVIDFTVYKVFFQPLPLLSLTGTHCKRTGRGGSRGDLAASTLPPRQSLLKSKLRSPGICPRGSPTPVKLG